MTDKAVQTLLDGFVHSVPSAVPVVAVWVHGSLALGDFVPGRSDLDLVCVTDGPLADPQPVQQLHRDLIRTSPLGEKLHCTYVPADSLADATLAHPTFAQGRYFDRPISPVARRELSLGNLALTGPTPASSLPATTDEELSAFIRRDLLEFWHPVTSKRLPWRRDVWVDLGLITYARASVTLGDGRLITKRAALELLPSLGAPTAVVQDIHARRYDDRRGPSLPWRIRRAHLTRTYLHIQIPALAT